MRYLFDIAYKETLGESVQGFDGWNLFLIFSKEEQGKLDKFFGNIWHWNKRYIVASGAELNKTLNFFLVHQPLIL